VAALLTYRELLLTGPEAVCLLDSNLSIKQHNQVLNILLGYGDKSLKGYHLSDILYDDLLIRRLIELENKNGWLYGEYILKTNFKFPINVKLRAGLLSCSPDGDYPIHHQKKEYAIVFREVDELRFSDYEKRLNALKLLLDISSGNIKPLKELITEFAKSFDLYVEVILVQEDKLQDIDKAIEFSIPSQLIDKVRESINKRTFVLALDETSWGFLPIYSSVELHSLACFKFSVPRLYDEIDRWIFNLAGIILGFFVNSKLPSFQPLLNNIIDMIDSSIIIVDKDGIIVHSNLASEAIYGYSYTEMIGKSFAKLVFPVDKQDDYAKLLSRVLNENVSHEIEMINIRKDLTPLDVKLKAYSFKLDNFNISGAIFIVQDLREKKHFLNKMISLEKSAALGEILQGIANELNNYLTPIIGFPQMLHERRIDKEFKEIIDIVGQAADRCGSIIRNVLRLAHNSHTQISYSDVNEIMGNAIELKKYQLLSDNIQVHWAPAGKIPYAKANPTDIERLFLHIISFFERRMLEYDGGGKLIIDSASEPEKIIIRFKDTGTCLLKAEISEIDDPLFISDEGEKSLELGLSISYHILRNIGGNLHIESQIGKGNILMVELPVANEEHIKSNNDNEKFNTNKIGKKKKILVVDDEPNIIKLVVEVLKDMGYTNDIAKDGQQAMKKLSQEEYDLIIADLRMPSGFTGEKLHNFINLRNPELAKRIIFITGDVLNPETISFLKNTGNIYLEKPFQLKNLKDSIQKVFSRQLSKVT